MRIKGYSEVQLDAVRMADMPKVYEALNVVSSVPFRINHFIHDAVLKVWESGGGIGEVRAVPVILHEVASLLTSVNVVFVCSLRFPLLRIIHRFQSLFCPKD